MPKAVGLRVHSAGRGTGTEFMFQVQLQRFSHSSSNVVRMSTIHQIKKNQLDGASMKFNDM